MLSGAATGPPVSKRQIGMRKLQMRKRSPIAALIFSAILLSFMASLPHDASALDHVTLRRKEKESRIQGKLLVTAEDGGLMLLTADGQMHSVQPDEVVNHTSDSQPFKPLTQADAAKQILAALPAGFEVHMTAHYIICHNTSKAYAQWCGALYERLYAAFINFWSRKGFALHEPELPMVCIVFADHASYGRWTEAELGAGTKHIIAYYSLQTNRVTMYDLTGSEALRRADDRRGSAAQINQMLARPDAERMVATIIHEATHQIAYNCGLQTRYADIPLWVSEGVAVYFEAPDLTSAKGWRTIGEVNRPRLTKFREYLSSRPADSLKSLLADDKRLRDPRQALDAYAEAWALNYFLIRQKPKEYTAYLQALAAKRPLVWDEPVDRLKEFKAAFGDLPTLDAEFLRHMQKVR